MSIKLYEGDFDDLTGAIFASWFTFNPNGPTACAVGFVETADTVSVRAVGHRRDIYE